MPELTLVTRYYDCVRILHRDDTFGVDLYKPKQGDYFMDQDDTANHWREKSIMKAILDFEQLPAIRAYVADKVAALLKQAGGAIEAVGGLTRAVLIALVQDWFGFTDSDPKDLFEWSYWNQIDTFWNQPFDSVAVADQESIVKKREDALKKWVPIWYVSSKNAEQNYCSAWRIRIRRRASCGYQRAARSNST
jgi:cytochrome P450